MVNTKKRTRPRTGGQKRDLNCLCVFDTSFGWVAVKWVAGQLDRLVFGHESPDTAVAALESEDDTTQVVAAPRDESGQFADRLRAYFDGAPDAFLDVPISLNARTDFQRAVLGHCRRIPYGQTRTYADLARAAGSPNACRAVGNIMARNRIPLIIPCHRVVGSHGSLGGYSAPSGLALKRQLLELEGAEIMA